MKAWNKFLRPQESDKLAFRGGTYSLAITALVLAILLVVNICVSALPASWTKLDISATKLYSITSNTKAVVNALEEDVTIYWIVQSGAEDDVIANLLSKYESLSDHIEVVKKNPDEYPTFAEQYTSEAVENNSLVVESGQRSRYIALMDIYTGELNAYSGVYEITDFDGEGAITSAIDYVINEEFPRVYILEGHGEAELPAAFREQMEKENLETETLTLLTAETIPEDADCVVIYGPESDISPEEADILADYVAGGGRLLVMAGAVETGALENLYSLLEPYGVTVEEGLVVDTDQEHYAFGQPYLLLPDLASHAITDPLIEENYLAVMPLSLGMVVDGSSSNGTVTELLTTSDASYNKAAGFTLETYEKESGDTDGPFALALSIEDNGGGSLVWFSSDEYLSEMYNAYSSGANLDMTMNALASLIGETDAMAIRSRSLTYDYLTISESTAAVLKLVMIGVFPLTCLGVGIGVVIKRKKVQHETD